MRYFTPLEYDHFGTSESIRDRLTARILLAQTCAYRFYRKNAPFLLFFFRDITFVSSLHGQRTLGLPHRGYNQGGQSHEEAHQSCRLVSLA